MKTKAFNCSPSVISKVTQLPDMPIAELKSLWSDLFGKPPPTYRRNFLERRIAYQLQENEFRQHNSDVLENNRKKIDALIRHGEMRGKVMDYQLQAGSLLIREYRGVDHQVLVLADDRFEYQGRIFKTLSAIANEITGSKWSGPLFFGLRSYGSTKPATKKRSRK